MYIFIYIYSYVYLNILMFRESGVICSILMKDREFCSLLYTHNVHSNINNVFRFSYVCHVHTFVCKCIRFYVA